MGNSSSRKVLYGAMVALYIAQATLHQGFLFNSWHKNYSPGKLGGGVAKGLSPDQILLQLFGFREFLAGILWVRADGFFDQGNYDAILPIIRLCTLLDPKQIDIYATGMWHVGYNFTDEEQRSDRRYLPSALALGKEGAENNPETYEMFFETGWMWYHKIDDDYDQSVKWFKLAQQRPDMIPARKDLLGNALSRDGKVDEALQTYYRLYDEALARKKAEPSLFMNRTAVSTVEHNIDTMIVRMTQRGWFAKQQGIFDQGDYDTKPPFDVKFSVKATVLEPFVLNVEGTWNVLPVGTRIKVDLRDIDYPGAKYAELDWDNSNSVTLDPPRNLTYMQDELYVKNRRFNKKLDMSKDRTMYPFLADKYLLEFYYNPRSAPAHIQDRFGYNAEGFTDSNFLRSDVRPNQKVVYASFVVTRDQIWKLGQWADKPVVFKTPNYVEPKAGTLKDDLILVPALRSGK